MSKLSLASTVSDLFFTKPNYERNIADIKNIYLQQLTSILTPCMFDSIKNIYNRSCEIAKGSKMSIEYAFKVCLKDLVNLSQQSIINEVSKIKSLSNSGSYFDNLVRSVIKSHIVLMSYNVSKESCPICDIRKYNIDINKFIHECYIELGNQIFNDPRIFIMCLKDGDELNNINGNIRCGNKFDKLVKKCISKVVFSFIPVNDVLVEYLNKDKITDDYIKAKQDIEKDEIVNRIIEGINEKIKINQSGGFNIDELMERIKNLISSNSNNIEQPINIQSIQSTIKQIDNVISNDISAAIITEEDKKSVKETEKEEEIKEVGEIKEVKENKEVVDEQDKQSVNDQVISDKQSNNDNEDNKEIVTNEDNKETVTNEDNSKVDNEKDNDSEEVLLDNQETNKTNLTLTLGQLETDKEVDKSEDNKMMQKEIEAIEQKEEPKRKRGRPKKFIETESLNTISLSKFKN